MHLTVFEVTNGLTADRLRPVIEALSPHLAELAALPATPIILDTPSINMDISGIAISFLPRDDTILRLRAGIWDVVTQAGVRMNMRYVLPSAHVTVGRLVERGRRLGMGRPEWVALVEDINEELRAWTGEWRIERLLVRAGTSWYGGGVTLNA